MVDPLSLTLLLYRYTTPLVCGEEISFRWVRMVDRREVSIEWAEGFQQGFKIKHQTGLSLEAESKWERNGKEGLSRGNVPTGASILEV